MRVQSTPVGNMQVSVPQTAFIPRQPIRPIRNGLADGLTGAVVRHAHGRQSTHVCVRACVCRCVHMCSAPGGVLSWGETDFLTGQRRGPGPGVPVVQDRTRERPHARCFPQSRQSPCLAPAWGQGGGCEHSPGPCAERGTPAGNLQSRRRGEPSRGLVAPTGGRRSSGSQEPDVLWQSRV